MRTPGRAPDHPGEVDPRPARAPDRTGSVERDGVRTVYDVYENTGRPTVVLMPTWSIVHSRLWKAQVPYLARHFRVVTFDGRGSGRSDRPPGGAAYADPEFAADAIAVMDAAAVDRAVLVSLSAGGPWSLHVAADQPARVDGLLAFSPAGMGISHPERRDATPWAGPGAPAHGWTKGDPAYWLAGGKDDFVRYFFSQMFHEPHSTKQTEDAVRWAGGITPERLVDTMRGMSAGGRNVAPIADVAARVSCPVLVVEGDEDRIRPAAAGERLAGWTGGRLVVLEGVGHGIPTRQPVLANRLIRSFVEELHPPSEHRAWVRSLRRPKRALYLSSPIGLGHARRDLEIARALRVEHPDLQVDWLAQHPVTAVLDDAGESVHPASAALASESGHVEDEAATGEHDLHAFQAIRRMDEILVNNFMVFQDLVEREHYDLVVGDEAWDLDYFLHENPELKRFAFAWMTDFVGWLPMPDGGAREAALTADYNAEMLEQRARFSRLRDRSIFVGSVEDVVEDSFGPGLPPIRTWTQENFDFSGYVTGFTPPSTGERARLRGRLGYGPDDLLCLVTVGGSGVGGPLLQRVLDAVPLARRIVPGLRFLVVCGPRIDPASLPRRRGVTVRGYLPELYRHLAACDVAVVQGGLTTCMELTATRRPFVYIPLQHHFEQQFHVRHRLDRYGAGRCLGYAEACDPLVLAEAIAKEVSREVQYRPVETDGAARAAALLADLL